MKLLPEAVIGVWDGHDAGVALVVEGKVVLALNEERLSGRKLEVGMPERSLAVVRKAAQGLRVRWAVTTSDPAKTLTRLWPSSKERYYKLRRRLAPPDIWYPLTQKAKYTLTQWPTGPWLRHYTQGYFARTLGVTREVVQVIDHHAAHAGAAAYWPGWKEEALVVTLDGIGDGSSGSVWRFRPQGGGLSWCYNIPGRSSLGLFFEHVTQSLQMRALEDEGKVMAMASYTPACDPATNPFLRWFTLSLDAQGWPSFHCTMPPGKMAAAVARIVWCTPREQVCRYAQQTVEQLIPRFFASLVKCSGVSNFAYSGGVASNIKVNKMIRLTPGVSRLAVCPAMGDGGLAMGAALYAWEKLTGQMPHSFTDFKLGPRHDDFEQVAEMTARETGSVLVKPKDLPQTVAEKISAGEIVMWAQGRMELGARALGARSIIARADSEAARDALNLRLKRRAWYQPFCPTILLSEASRLLADYRGSQDDNFHMTMGYQVTAAGRSALAGAIGPDGSCRPQMVAADPADPWARLLECVQALTGTGAVINTSLNIHGKPMPDRAEDIVQAWRESGVAHLALGPCLISKQSGPAASGVTV